VSGGFVERLSFTVRQIFVRLSQQHACFIEEHADQLGRALGFRFGLDIDIAVFSQCGFSVHLLFIQVSLALMLSQHLLPIK
jgi:hypothetical protein